MIVRKLCDSDYPAVLKLYEALDKLHADARPDCNLVREVAYPKDAYDEVTTHPDCLMLGAFDVTGTILGTVRATLWEDSGMVKDLKNVCLDNIYVLPAYRRMGIAKKLFLEVENWAREKGAVRLELHVWDFNRDAMALYTAMGMTPQRYVLEKKLKEK